MPYTIYILNAKLTIRLICTIAVVSSILFSCDKEPDPLHFDETLILGEYNVDVSFIVDTVMYGWVPFPRPIENYSGELSIKNTDVLLTIGKNMEGYYMSFDSIYSRDSIYVNQMVYFDLEEQSKFDFRQDANIVYKGNQGIDDLPEMRMVWERSYIRIVRSSESSFTEASSIHLYIGFVSTIYKSGVISRLFLCAP
jgi:hypothetical protein